MPGNIRDIEMLWSEMESQTPKQIYMACMAMCILALVGSILLSFMIFFGITCRATGRLLYLLSCGMLKWILSLWALFVFLCVILSWSIFLMFPMGTLDRKEQRTKVITNK